MEGQMAASFSVFFINNGDLNFLSSQLGRLEAKALTTVSGSDWAVYNYRPGAAPPNDDVLTGSESIAVRLSRKVGEVIYLFADTRPDSLVYEHARGETLLRKLVWFSFSDESEASWLCSAGERESWEDRLFSPNLLSQAIEEEKTGFEDSGRPHEEFESRKLVLEQMWERKMIVENSRFPKGGGFVSALIERAFGLQKPS
jgi:hypothetical protein